MVTVRGGGSTYEISSGKKMEWEEVPEWFKDAVVETEARTSPCDAIFSEAQKCVAAEGFWSDRCGELVDEFHRCDGVELQRSMLPATVAGDPKAAQKKA